MGRVDHKDYSVTASYFYQRSTSFSTFSAFLKLKQGSAGILDMIFRVRVAPSSTYLRITNHFRAPLKIPNYSRLSNVSQYLSKPCYYCSNLQSVVWIWGFMSIYFLTIFHILFLLQYLLCIEGEINKITAQQGQVDSGSEPVES